MARLKFYKEKVKGVKKTAKMTKAMEAISAIKMRYAQRKAIMARHYAFYLFSVLKRISKLVAKNVDDIFSQTCDVDGKIMILLVSTDKGLTGGMNNFLFKRVKELINEDKIEEEKLSFICIGKKGKEFVERNGWKVEKYFPELNEKSVIEDVDRVTDYVLRKYKKEDLGKIYVVYMNFISTTLQKPNVRVLLPVVYKELKSFLKRILPKEGRYSDLEKVEIDESEVRSYIFEPSIEEFLKSMTPLILRVMIFYAMLESFASEHSARMVAMKNATDQALSLAERFRKKFNKERQAVITKEISEIVSAIEAIK